VVFPDSGEMMVEIEDRRRIRCRWSGAVVAALGVFFFGAGETASQPAWCLFLLDSRGAGHDDDDSCVEERRAKKKVSEEEEEEEARAKGEARP